MFYCLNCRVRSCICAELVLLNALTSNQWGRMGKSTVEIDLTISGPEDDLKAFADWVNSQTNDQAPSAPWAALYNLEQEANAQNVCVMC